MKQISVHMKVLDSECLEFSLCQTILISDGDLCIYAPYYTHTQTY